MVFSNGIVVVSRDVLFVVFELGDDVVLVSGNGIAVVS